MRLALRRALCLAAAGGLLAVGAPDLASAAAHGAARVVIVSSAGHRIHLDDGHQLCPLDPDHPDRVNGRHTTSSVGACATIQDGVAVLADVAPGRWQLRIFRGVGPGPCYNRDGKGSPCSLAHVVAGTTIVRKLAPWPRTAHVTLVNQLPTRLKIRLYNPALLGTWRVPANAHRQVLYTTWDTASDVGGDGYAISMPDHPGCGLGDEGSQVFFPRHSYRFTVYRPASGGSTCTDENGHKAPPFALRIVQTD